MLDEVALQWSARAIAKYFESAHFYPYAPVKRQMWNLWRQVNRRRQLARMDLVPKDCVMEWWLPNGCRRIRPKPFIAAGDRTEGLSQQLLALENAA